MIKKNTIAFRLNVSSEIGYGHIKRLQTLSSFFSSFVFVIPKSSLDILIRSGVPKEKILTFSDNLGGWWNSISGLTHIVTDIMNSGNKIFIAPILRLITSFRCEFSIIYLISISLRVILFFLCNANY